MASVHLNQAAIKALLGNAEIDAALLQVGDKVAERAAQSAPKRSGAGAASLRAEAAGGEVHVGWDRDHFYMLFHEIGTSRQSARPFLRPALDARYDI